MCFYGLPHWDISVISDGYVHRISLIKCLDDLNYVSNLSLNDSIINSLLVDANYFPSVQ